MVLSDYRCVLRSNYFSVIGACAGPFPKTHYTVKTKHLFSTVLTCFGENKTGVVRVRILIIFQDRLTFSHINGELSLRLFELCC